MNQCPACAAAVGQDSQFCANCGAALAAVRPTTPLSPTTPVAAPEGVRTPRPNNDGDARFLPGAMLHERYRIIALLGRGGMGEVYRADDIKLGQPVALKFLPESLARDADARERFFAEVRIGRQVSHPNVCRLYDVIEVDGHLCLSMEYVDGEDLAALLKRIGRLPADKAVDFARDVTAGLAAAHDKGVIHRDLKPANIMIDGKGRARITDFGIAALADDAAHAGFAGTPAYMAPEQLDGAPASVRTDLYALGAVLYEAFTGKRLFETSSIEQLKALHANTVPPSLSSSARDIPPAVEELVRRCLARDPNARPLSALAVMAALPGGDPLQAAIAAGETPTPAMVAAAGKVGDLSVVAAWGLLLASLAGLILLAALAARTTMIGRLHPELSLELLNAKAEQVLTMFGYPSPPVDHAATFAFDQDYLRAQTADDHRVSLPTPESARPGPLLFEYRGAQQPLVAKRAAELLFSPGEVGRVLDNDPPLSRPGMTRVTLDRHGQLTEFIGVPPDREDAGATHAIDWNAALSSAGLDAAHLQPSKSTWTAPVDTDSKQAWDGTYADQPDVPLHVEAAAYRGKPVWFAVIGSWHQPHDPSFQVLASKNLSLVLWAMLIIGSALMIAIVVMASRNLRLGRGDRRGAFRLGVVVYTSLAAALLLRADHAPLIADEVSLLMNIAVQATFFGVDAWLLYIAFEPYARRRWPHLMISWSRLLAGRFADPLVARDLTLGVLGGMSMVLVVHLAIAVPSFIGHIQRPPIAVTISTLTANKHVAFVFLGSVFVSSTLGIMGLALMFMFGRVLRVPLLTHVAMFAFFYLVLTGTTPQLSQWSSEGLVFTAIWYGLMVRTGVLAAAAGYYVMQTLLAMPLTLDMHAWYAERTVIVFVLFGALLIYAFHRSLGGKSPFGAAFSEHDDA